MIAILRCAHRRRAGREYQRDSRAFGLERKRQAAERAIDVVGGQGLAASVARRDPYRLAPAMLSVRAAPRLRRLRRVRASSGA